MESDRPSHGPSGALVRNGDHGRGHGREAFCHIQHHGATFVSREPHVNTSRTGVQMFRARTRAKKDDDDAGAKPWHAADVRGAHSVRRLRGVLLGALGLVLLGLIASGVGRGMSNDWAQMTAGGDDADAVGDSVERLNVSEQWPAHGFGNDSAAQHAHYSGSGTEPTGSRAAALSAAAAKHQVRKRLWVTEELAEYASLITDDVMQAWALMEADQKHTPSPFTLKQSEFYAALTLLSLNVSTVCELGAADGRSAITWLEALPWTQVYSFGRARVPDSGAVQEDGSFGPPLMEASGEPRTVGPAPTAASGQQALARQYLLQKYRGRYNWQQLSSTSAAELQRVAREQGIDKCDVIAISADQTETPTIATGAPHDGGSSVDISTPLPTLKADLVAMRQLTNGWHFLLVDGMGCSDQEAAKAAAQAAAQAVDKATASPAAAVGGLLRGPPSTIYGSSDAQVGAGRKGRSAGSCAGNEATQQLALAPPPQRVRATWEAVVGEGVVVEYECRTGESNLPGWCLGTYRSEQFSSPPGGGSWFKREGMVDTAVGTGGANDDGTPRMLSWISSEGMYLNVGDQLRSKQDEFYLSMQEDGNLVIYRTHGDDDGAADESGGGAAKPVWSSRTSGSVGNYFLSLQVNNHSWLLCHLSGLNSLCGRRKRPAGNRL